MLDLQTFYTQTDHFLILVLHGIFEVNWYVWKQFNEHHGSCKCPEGTDKDRVSFIFPPVLPPKGRMILSYNYLLLELGPGKFRSPNLRPPKGK